MSSAKQELKIGDNVYNILRKSIIELNIKPGESISIKELCEQLSAGRSPIRDALIKLEKEGLIKSLPQKGTIIAKIDMDRVAEEQFLRECLEEKTMQIFMQQYEPSDINKLKDNLEQQKQSIKSMDSRKFLQYDEEFHEIIYLAAGKPLVWKTIQSTSGHYRRIRLLTLIEPDILKKTLSQHEQMISYIEMNKIEELSELVHEHVTKLKTEELDMIDKYPDLFEVTQKEIKSNNVDGVLQKDFLGMLLK